MADNTQIPTGQPSQGSGAEQVFGKYLAKIGVEFDTQTAPKIKKSLDPVQKYIQNFNKTTDFKNTFFGKLPGIKKSLQALLPDNVRFLNNMMAIGNASRAGADDMQFYNNNLGFFGKGLTRLTSIFFETGEGATVMGRMVAAGASMATLGIAALVAIAIALLQAVRNILGAALDWQNQLNDFNKILGGVTRDRLMAFNEGLNQTVKSIGQYGFALNEVTNTVKAYLVSGLNPAIALNSSLVETTMKLHEVTGDSNTEIASLFSNIIRGSKVTVSNFKALGGSFAVFNRSVEASGIIGTVSFGDVKEAITSVGSALLIASNKSKLATNRMMNDLVALTGLAKALNISVSELNGKFEEASNLISSQESGFRAILAISGGANIQNLLSNQFNRTEAMLKVSGELAKLNQQFGGNLNILGQVAEQTFGLSKDVAIKLATMSQEQRKALLQAKQDSELLQNVGLQKAYESVTSTLSSAWERFKNFFITAFHRALAGNTGLQTVINRISSIFSSWVTQVNNPNSVFAKIVDKIGSFVTTIAEKIADWLPGIEKFIDSISDWFTKIISGFESGGFLKGLGNLLFEILKFPIMMLGHVLSATLKQDFFGKGILSNDEKNMLQDIENQNKEDLVSRKGLNTEFTKQASDFSDKLSKLHKEQSKLEGLKDTDIIVGKNGQFTLAGLERLELQSKEDEIVDSQNKLIKSQEDNTAALQEHTKELQAIRNTTLKSSISTTATSSTNITPVLGTIAKRTLMVLNPALAPFVS